MRELRGASRTCGALMGCTVVHRGRCDLGVQLCAKVRQIEHRDTAPPNVYPRYRKYQQTLPPHAIIGGIGWAVDDSVQY
jgi:hypothetical protein